MAVRAPSAPPGARCGGWWASKPCWWRLVDRRCAGGSRGGRVAEGIVRCPWLLVARRWARHPAAVPPRRRRRRRRGDAGTRPAHRPGERRRSARSPPCRDAAAESGTIGRRRVVVGLATATLATGALAIGTFGHLALVGLGSVLLLAATLVLAPLAARPASSALGGVLDRGAWAAGPAGPGQRHAQPPADRLDGHRAGGRGRRRLAVHRLRGLLAHRYRRRGARRVR